MKKIVCELCEGTQFTKEGGFFICHGCGTKYSLEEAKSMMREVEGESEPFVGDSSVVTMPVGNPNQQQIDNILLLASNAYSASNNEETEKYCNRAIELDASCYKAWLLKGKAIGWQTTTQKSRVAEAAYSFKQAVDFAPEEEKENLTSEAAEELKRLALACISLRQKRFSQYPDKDELNGFVSDIEPFVDGLVVLYSKGADMAQINKVVGLIGALDGISGLSQSTAPIKFLGIKLKAGQAGVPKEFFSQIAVMMTSSALDAYSNLKLKWNNESHPLKSTFTKYLYELDNCESLLDMAISASDEDFDADIQRYQNMIAIIEEPLSWKAFDSYSSTFPTVSLSDEAKANRRKSVQETRNKIKEVENKKIEMKAEKARKAEEERKARIQAYWEAHAEEKAALDTEKTQLSKKRDDLNNEIMKLSAKIVSFHIKEKAKVPSEEEADKLKDQIRSLENRRANLGLFSGKEKKQITEEIASLQGRIDSLKDKIDEEKKAREEEIKKEIAPLQREKDELVPRLDAINKKISAIEAEFTKDPE